jgi:hypothetical protein
MGAAVSIGLFLYSSRRPPEAVAGGEVGEVIAYGQIPAGPIELQADVVRRLPRPQDFAFQFRSQGFGPRFVRIELEVEERSSVVYEDRIGAPTELDSLEFVLRVGDDDPDRVALVVTIEAPHAMSVTRRYPIELVGPERRFWEKE